MICSTLLAAPYAVCSRETCSCNSFDTSVFSSRGKGHSQCRQGDLPLTLGDACLVSGQSNTNSLYLLVFFFCWRNATFPLSTVVFVSLLLIICCSPAFPFPFPQRRVSRIQDSRTSIGGAEPWSIHDAVRDGELLLVQDFLLAQPKSVNEQR